MRRLRLLILGLLILGACVLVARDACAQQSVPAERPRTELSAQIAHVQPAVFPFGFSPDGALFVTASQHFSSKGDASLKLWDMASGKLLRSFEGHTGRVEAAAFSPDGKRIVTGGGDKTLKLWDAASGRLLRTFEGHEAGVMAAAFSPDGGRLVSAGADNTARLWDAETGALVHIFKAHSDFVRSAAFSPGGDQIATGSADKTVKLWSARTGNVIRSFSGHPAPVSFVAFSSDGARILSKDDNILSDSIKSSVKIWSAATGKVITSFGERDHYSRDKRYAIYQRIFGAAFTQDGKRVISKGAEGDLYVWDAASGKRLQNIEMKGNPYGAASFSPDGRWALAGEGHTLRLWGVATGEVARSFAGAIGLSSAVYSADGARILVRQSDFRPALWNAATGALTGDFRANEAVARSHAFSPDGLHVLSEDAHYALNLWEAVSGRLIRSFAGHTDFVREAVFSPSGDRIVSSQRDGSAKLWDAATGKLIRDVERDACAQDIAAFSSRGDRFLTGAGEIWCGKGYCGCKSHQLKIWDTASGEFVQVIDNGGELITSAVFSPSGAQALTAGSEGTAKLWDVASGKLIRVFDGHKGIIFSAVFSADGAHVLTGGGDLAVKLWDAATGALVRSFAGHKSAVTSVAFAPNGAGALSASTDGTMRLWDVATGRELLTMAASTSGQWLAITPAGFFDGSEGAPMLAAVRGLEVLPVEPFRARLQRPDIIRALLAGRMREYDEAAVGLDLEKVSEQ